MRIHPVSAAAVSLFAATAWAQQAGDNPQVFHFTNAATPAAMQEIVNAVRTIGELRNVSVQMDARLMTVQAAPSDLALARWIVQELDVPSGPQAPSSLQVDRYPGLTNPTDQVRIFRLAHADSPTGFQETVNAVRTIPEMPRVFPDTSTLSIVTRDSDDRLAVAEWLLQQLDQPAAPPGARAEQKFQTLDPRDPELRVLYFAHATVPLAYQEVVNALRTVAGLARVFPVTNKRAIAIRGNAGQAALAEWLFGELDKSGPEPAAKASPVEELSPGLDVARVFFLPGSVTPQSLQAMVGSLRTATQAIYVFPCSSLGALVFRGTPAQLAQAESIVGQTAKL